MKERYAKCGKVDLTVAGMLFNIFNTGNVENSVKTMLKI